MKVSEILKIVNDCDIDLGMTVSIFDFPWFITQVTSVPCTVELIPNKKDL